MPARRRLTLKILGKRMYARFVDHAVTDTAAQLSYYFLFALFPFLFFLVALTAYLPLGSAITEGLSRLADIMPPAAMKLIQDHLSGLATNTHPKLLTLGAAVTIWSASRGVDAMRKALNLAYDVTESRPYWKTQIIAVGGTVVGTLLTLLAITMILLGGKAGFWLADKLELGTQFLVAWSWLRWPFTALLVMLIAALGYYFLPDVKQEFRYITPGSVLGTLGWLLATWGFTQYADHFG